MPGESSTRCRKANGHFNNFPPHVRGLVISARAPRRPGGNIDRRSPAAKLEAVAESLRSHFPLASDDQLRQAAADAIETYSGHTLPAPVNRRIGGRVPNVASEFSTFPAQPLQTAQGAPPISP
jgi:hypothetical protein